MKLLLTILLFTTLSAKAQEVFVLNRSYPVGWVVYYPADTFWITTRPLVSRTFPSVMTGWKRYYYPVATPAPIPTPTTVEVVTKSAFDSLLARVRLLEAKQVAPEVIDSLDARVDVIEQLPQGYTLKVSQAGFPLIYFKNGVATLKSFVAGKAWGSNDSTIIYPK